MWAKLLGGRFFHLPSPVLTVLESHCPPGQKDHGNSPPSHSWAGSVEPSYRSAGNGPSKTRLGHLPSKIQPIFHLRLPLSAVFSVWCVPSSHMYLLNVQLFSRYPVKCCSPGDIFLFPYCPSSLGLFCHLSSEPLLFFSSSFNNNNGCQLMSIYLPCDRNLLRSYVLFINL